MRSERLCPQGVGLRPWLARGWLAGVLAWTLVALLVPSAAAGVPPVHRPGVALVVTGREVDGDAARRLAVGLERALGLAPGAGRVVQPAEALALLAHLRQHSVGGERQAQAVWVVVLGTEVQTRDAQRALAAEGGPELLLDGLLSAVAEVPAGQRVVVLDTRVPPGAPVPPLAAPPDTVLLAGSAPTSGALSARLLGGLLGEADLEGDGEVSLAELALHLRRGGRPMQWALAGRGEQPAARRALSTVAHAAEPQRVHLESVPAGARVRVGSEWVGETPVSVRLEPGVHPVQLELEGYDTQRLELLVPAHGGLQRVTLAPADEVLAWGFLMPHLAYGRRLWGDVWVGAQLGAIQAGLDLDSPQVGATGVYGSASVRAHWRPALGPVRLDVFAGPSAELLQYEAGKGHRPYAVLGTVVGLGLGLGWARLAMELHLGEVEHGPVAYLVPLYSIQHSF